MAAITASAAPILARNDSTSSFYLVENDSIEIDRIGNCSSDDTESISMNTPHHHNSNNNIEANSNNHHNGPLNSLRTETPLYTQSLVITSKTSLIDNTLAQGFSLKRARSLSSPSDMKKSNSDGMIGTKRMKLQQSYCPTTVVISSSNPTSLSASSSSSLPPEENLCPYSFIESLLNDTRSSSGGCSTEEEEGLSSSSNSSRSLLFRQQPLTDDDFSPPTPEMIDAYSNDALSAVRSSDVNSLRQLRSAGHSLECCNRFGESLLHVACRRSNAEIVSFLLNEAKVSPCIRDDYGRTPLHDACWRGNPEYEIVELLLSVEPRLAFVKDVRGHRPFQYARREHWSCWRNFIDEKRELILRPLE